MSEPEIVTLFDNEWLSLLLLRAPDAGVGGYVFSHETRCWGRIVAVLPFRRTAGGLEFAVKAEVTPCWSLEPVESALTGGYEGGDITGDAVRELFEEAGFDVAPGELLSLGTSYASKSADTVYSLFAVDVTDKAASEPVGDGTRLESEAAVVWVSRAEVVRVADPQVAVMVLRLESAMDRLLRRVGQQRD